MKAVLIAAETSLDDGTWDQSAINQEVCSLAFALSFAQHPPEGVPYNIAGY